jgi:hypothetical protein
MKSVIEKLILDRSFDYLQPYFYSNPYALRCELGIGDTTEEYMKNARERAASIYHILFPQKADAIIFNYWIYDWSDTGDAEKRLFDGDPEAISRIIDQRLRDETRALRFLSEMLMDYRHVSVKDLKTYDDPTDADAGSSRRNRIVCYADDIGFDDLDLIEKQIKDDKNSEVSLVSFQNECIFSVYDDRGCDIVFSTYEKMREFYSLLKAFFLPYDLEEMEKRLARGM